MKIVFSLFMFFLFIQNLVAQDSELFIVDSTNLSVKQRLPFDRPFILGFRGSSAKSIYSAYIFEWVIEGRKRTLKHSKDGDGKVSLARTFIEPYNVFNIENGSDVYIHAQPPNKNFAILLNHRFDGDLLDEALQASWHLYKNNPAGAATVLNSLNSKVEDKIRPLPGVPLAELKKISPFAYDWQDPSSGSSVEKGFTDFYTKKLNSIYSNLFITISAPDALTESNVFAVVQAVNTVKLSTVEFSPLVSLVSRSMLNSILEGTVAFQKDFVSSQVKIHDLTSRLKNLNTSLDEIEKLRQYSELIQSHLNNDTLKQLIADLGTLGLSVEKNRDNLKKVSEDVLKAMADEGNLIYPSWAFAHNEVWDLKTRGSYRLIPDIGIVTIFGIGNEKSEVIVRPYVGANFYFRPVDKNVPFKYFDKRYRYLQRLSASLGVTVGKMEQGEFSDFFNNMNLLFGGNYKITREFSFSGGLAFLKRRNANLGMEDKTTTLNPYVGISFDIDFTHAIQKLTGKYSL